MSEYTLEIKQIVDYPRCRIYRQFVQALIADRSIRVSGGSGLFYFVVLCAYANFRTSYKRIDGISYTIYPGEWIMSVEELSRYFRTRFRRQTLAALEGLQKKGLISFLVLGHGKLVKFKIRGWRRHNTILDYCDVTRSVSKMTEIERRGGKRWDKPKKAEKSRDCGGGKF